MSCLFTKLSNNLSYKCELYYNQWRKADESFLIQNIEFTVVHSSIIINCKVIFHQLGHFTDKTKDSLVIQFKNIK